MSIVAVRTGDRCRGNETTGAGVAGVIGGVGHSSDSATGDNCTSMEILEGRSATSSTTTSHTASKEAAFQLPSTLKNNLPQEPTKHLYLYGLLWNKFTLEPSYFYAYFPLIAFYKQAQSPPDLPPNLLYQENIYFYLGGPTTTTVAEPRNR